MYFCLKLLSASSWGCELKSNSSYDNNCAWMSASSWGCELKYCDKPHHASSVPSASSWGCELKYDISGTHPQLKVVSLFVRLWVEIIHKNNATARERSQPLREAVSWNVNSAIKILLSYRQPLREAVSWNSLRQAPWLCPEVSASSWGCELKYDGIWRDRPDQASQPLREAVSWNIEKGNVGTVTASQPLREAVSWNNKGTKEVTLPLGQPLREAVSWNINMMYNTKCKEVSLFVRLWVEMR